MRGISGLRGVPEAIKVLREVYDQKEQKEKEESPARELIPLEEAQAIADFAQSEVDKGFPILHAHALVGLWGTIEVMVEDLIIAFLINEDALLKRDAFSKVRIPLADFEGLEKEERMRLLVVELERASGLNRKFGVDRFESLLGPIDLSGTVEPDIRKEVRALHHIRNIVVHRASVADRRMVEGCPWLNLQIGEKVVVTHDVINRSNKALVGYVVELIHRVGDRFGVDTRNNTSS
jgi:hypothetical protein